MTLIWRRYIGLLLTLFGLGTLCAQPILIQPQNQSAGGNGVSNIRIINQSADGTEITLGMDFAYDGLNGPSARILPVIADKKQTQISAWFGADPATIGTGHGPISVKVKFFNDEPGVPAQITTDRIRVMMLSSSGNSIVSQNIFL